MLRRYMAIDQYGHTHLLGRTKHPRKALLDKLGYSHADKIYRDQKDGTTVHTGYIVGGLWCELYQVTPFKQAE